MTRVTPLFSEVDADLNAMKWRADKDGYARAGRCIYAHRLVLSRILGRPLDRGEIPDHIHGNILDNRREMIRLTDWRGNAQNRRTTEWKGTCLAKSGKWQASVKYCGRSYYLGQFVDRKDALAASNAKRRELNFLSPES